MKLIQLEDKYFLYKKIKNINLVVSTANTEFGIHPKLENYDQNIEFIKKKFDLLKIFTVSQTHSNIVHTCDYDFVNGFEGDGLITKEKKCAVGVFTADCVPIFLFDTNKQVVSVVHSGWKGIYKEIVVNDIDVFIEKYNSNVSDICVYIGPHNMKCCYEIGEDLKNKFLNHERFKNNLHIFNGNNLDMVECIKISLLSKGILEQNINVINYCTYCSEDVKFYSYRKNNLSLNRIFSFIFID